jgi:hypothetical protein
MAHERSRRRAVPVSTPAGGWADHVGIVAGVNSNGTVDLVNGDFGGDGVPITVEQDNSISIASWASQVWNSGEKWIFVSPGAVTAPSPRLPAISSFTASASSPPGAGHRPGRLAQPADLRRDRLTLSAAVTGSPGLHRR